MPCRADSRGCRRHADIFSSWLKAIATIGIVMHSRLGAFHQIWLFEILARRKVARKYRLLDELLWIICPELAHLRIGLDDRVGELAVDACHFANVNVEDRRSVFVQSYRPNRTVGKPDLVHGFEKCRCVICLCANCLEGFLDDEKCSVGTSRIESGVVFVCGIDASDKFVVVWCIQARRIPAPRIDSDRFITHHPKNAFIGACCIAKHGDFALQPKIVELLEKAHRIAAGKSHIDCNPVRFLKQFNDFGLKGKIAVLGNTTSTDEGILRVMGDEAIGVYTGGWYAAGLDTPDNNKFVAGINAANKHDPGFYTAGPYTALLIIEEALKTTGGKTDV